MTLDIASVHGSPPRAFGQYEVLAELGRGGMGIVYRARSSVSGSEVAVKTIRDRTARSISALRAEVTALKSVSHHGIVRILDDALLDIRPWYAMELVRGRGLDAYNQELHPIALSTSASSVATARVPHQCNTETTTSWSPPRPASTHREVHDSLHQILRIFAALSDALAHLHRQGLVHRDIKPSNVILDKQLRPKLLDFGLASRFDGPLSRSMGWLNEPGRLAGTLPYLSPEAIRGRLLDSRSDLYSLGCMLYESLVGHPPFYGVDTDDVLRAHVHSAPVPPSALVRDLPPAIDELVLLLLRKEVRDRTAYADEIATRINAIVGETTGAPPDGAVGAHLLKPNLTGRDADMAQLNACARRASASNGSVVTLRGESGIGKSFLLSEFAAEAASVGFLVIAGTTPAPAAPGAAAGAPNPPLATIRGVVQALADRCRPRGPSRCEPLTGEDLRLLARYEPALSAIPGFDELEEPGLPAEALGDERVLVAVGRALEFLSANAPLLLVLDDIQWADRLTERFLSELPAWASTRRLLAVCARRDEPLDAHSSSAPRGIGDLEIFLTRLGDQEIRTLAADMLGIRDLPRALAHVLTSQSAGSPLFVAEYMRAAIAAQLFRRRDGQWIFNGQSGLSDFHSLPLPSTVDDLLSSRIASLSSGAAEVLHLAAVIGREIDPDLLQKLLPKLDVWAALAELRRCAVLGVRPGGQSHFLHDRLREKTYARIPESELRELHRSVARELELKTSWSERRAALLPQIANHWSAGEEHVLAARAFKSAGDYARDSGAHADAARYFEAAIAMLEGHAHREPTIDLSLLAESAGDLLLILAQPERAEHRFLKAEVGTTDPIVLARLRRKRASTYTLRQDADRALELLQAAEDELRRAKDPVLSRAEWIDVRIERAWSLYWPGRATELSALIRETETVVRAFGSPLQRVRLLHCEIMSELRSSQYVVGHATLVKCREAAGAAELRRSPVEALSARFTLGFALVLRGEAREAVSVLEATLRGAEDLAEHARVIRTRAYLSLAHRLNGDVEGARLSALATLDLDRSHSRPYLYYRGLALANLGWVAMKVGDGEAALRRLLDSVEIWKDAAPAYPFMGYAAWPLLIIAASRQDVDAARNAAGILLRADQQGVAQDLHLTLLRLASSTGNVSDVATVVTTARCSDVPATR